MDDIWEEIMGDDKPTAKTLFKLVAREGMITAEDAAQLLGADRKDVDSWIRLLLEKKYVVAEGTPPNPTLRLSEELIAKIEERTWGVVQKVEGTVPTRTGELERERQLRRSLEEVLKDKEHIIDGLQDELLVEKKEKTYLEEKVKFMEMKMREPGASDLADLGVRLERERAERLKLEELLRRKQEELDNFRPPEEPTERPEPAKAGEPDEKKPAELRPWAQLADGGEIKPPKTKEEPSRVEPAYMEAPAVSVEEKDATDLVRLLASKGAMKEKDAASELKVEEKTLRTWIEDLVGKGAVKAEKHLFGGRDVQLKKDANVDALISELHAQKIKEEFTRLRGAK